MPDTPITAYLLRAQFVDQSDDTEWFLDEAEAMDAYAESLRDQEVTASGLWRVDGIIRPFQQYGNFVD